MRPSAAMSFFVPSRSDSFAMPNPWDVPPRPADGTKNPDDIYREVGGALSSWEFIESYIARIFALLVADNAPVAPFNRPNPALRAYGSVVSFQSRTAMVEAAAAAFFHNKPHPEFESRFKALMKAANGWAGRRNDIAHGKIGGWNPDLNKCVLWPNDFNSRKNALDDRAAYAYNDQQIKEIGEKFMDLAGQFGELFREFWTWRLGGPEELPE
jgi:hypothetical protein